MRNLLLIAIATFAVGCSGKNEPTTETKPVEEKVQEVKEEAKTEEPLAETNPELEGVTKKELENREGIDYLKGSDTPYTGKVFALYENGKKKQEGNLKDGKMDGLWVGWHENGKKAVEGNFKDGKQNGLHVMWFKNEQKEFEANFKDGKYDGLVEEWHKNGQKAMETKFKDGVEISGKYWNSKGEPVDTYKEAKK
tara:strand:- start:734 stop:1318 length:585 start_codon:yes stop_codon:yes gene_type:complete